MQEEIPTKNLTLFEKAINRTRVGMIITDPSEIDNPIIFANDGFYELTGYTSNEVIGKNCRFLQGEKTDRRNIDKIREAIKQEQAVEVQLYNYKKDGTGFWNELTIDPVWIEEEQKMYFVGIQKDVTEEKENTRRLQETLTEIEEISTPIVPVTENAVVLPLIGNFTDNRFDATSSRLSYFFETAEEDYLIIDLSGLLEMDTYVVSKFLQISQLASLMGKKTLLAGVRPDLALKTLGLVDTVDKISTFVNVKSALDYIANKKEGSLD
ncbi:PAS domain-containing protein [Gracilibacillus oryzae]|uniref:PAS domain-containing protein n=1 Tax=Gracilibacillus oryzae TaxID=1672701 RepID=A0A7C8GU75_9BACI|nr:STAS domain-containing protein [Gracilibacillus oryzae]KAB8137447.1 PAS domain-containing protein [Gracilibacillus oryzae]